MGERTFKRMDHESPDYVWKAGAVNELIDDYNAAVDRIIELTDELNEIKKEIDNCQRAGCPLKKARTVSVGQKLADLKKLRQQRDECNERKRE